MYCSITKVCGFSCGFSGGLASITPFSPFPDPASHPRAEAICKPNEGWGRAEEAMGIHGNLKWLLVGLPYYHKVNHAVIVSETVIESYTSVNISWQYLLRLLPSFAVRSYLIDWDEEKNGLKGGQWAAHLIDLDSNSFTEKGDINNELK